MRAKIRSKLTTKSQTNIPVPVRQALRLHKGDELEYEIDGARVVLTKAVTFGPFEEWQEWEGEADQRAYADL